MWSHTLGSTVGADPEVAMDKDLRRNLTDGEFPTKAEETTTTFVSECLLPTKRGNFHLRAYKHYGRGRALEPVVMMAVSDFSTAGLCMSLCPLLSCVSQTLPCSDLKLCMPSEENIRYAAYYDVWKAFRVMYTVYYEEGGVVKRKLE